MLKLDAKIDLNLQQFLHWWAGELAFLAPEPLIRLLGGRRAKLLLTRSNEALNLHYLNEEGVRTLGQWSLDEIGEGKREELYAENPEFEEAELLLGLGPEQSLIKSFKLPAATEENLHQVIAFEMDRLTPFKADQVYFDARIVERMPATGQIRVKLALTPRKKLDEMLAELFALGWMPEGVDVGRPDALLGHDLMPDKFRQAKSRWPKILTIGSFIVFLGLLVAALVLPAVMNHRLLDELQQEVRSVGKVAQEVKSLQEEAEKLSNESSFLVDKKRQDPMMLDMLEELTKLIPDQTSLNGLQYRDRKVTIQGESPAASSLIERIEASPYFKNASFVSPVTKDVANNQERFQISSEVVNGRFSEKPSN